MKRMMYYGTLSLALCAAMLTGCEKKLGITPKELTFDTEGGTKSFNISCNGN